MKTDPPDTPPTKEPISFLIHRDWLEDFHSMEMEMVCHTDENGVELSKPILTFYDKDGNAISLEQLQKPKLFVI